MNIELREALHAARQEVLGAPGHELSFATRKTLLLALGPVIKNEKGRTGTVGPGLTRRARLCVDSVERVLPTWEGFSSSRDPHTLLDMAESRLAGRVEQAALNARAYSFRGGLDNPDVCETTAPLYVGRAAVCAAFVAAWDELLEPKPEQGITVEELYDPQDPDNWDCAFWVAGAEAGAMPWVEGFDEDRYREFWLWYLDTGIPNAWAAAPE